MSKLILTGCCVMLLSVSLLAEEKATPAPSDTVVEAESPVLEPHEQAFVDMLSNTTMVGTFSLGHQPDKPPKEERYTIQAVRKVQGEDWIVQARVTYGKIDVPVPVPVKMKWAGDTPVLQVTDLSIPLIGDAFTARVMFYKDHYAGTWWHGKVGGHMWGKLEHAKKSKPETLPESN